MKRTLLKSKIHRATVTEADLNYEGSITIDARLMKAADIVEYERVEVYDITNGNRLATYAIPGEAGSGTICLNGAAARLVAVGDLIIICTYADYDDAERAEHVPTVLQVTEQNKLRRGSSKRS
ncbi:MAG: aspartate 1-decarboxylase [Planctomycetaceae bacterium]